MRSEVPSNSCTKNVSANCTAVGKHSKCFLGSSKHPFVSEINKKQKHVCHTQVARVSNLPRSARSMAFVGELLLFSGNSSFRGYRNILLLNACGQMIANVVVIS